MPVREIGRFDSARARDLHRSLPLLILIRAAIVFAGLNLADPLGLLPHRVGAILFLPFFNIITVLFMLAYLGLWWSGRHVMLQLYAQIVVDLAVTTFLVASTRGIESAFVSFYILIIIYCSLMLGRNGGMVGAALSTILYAGMMMANQLSLLLAGGTRMELQNAAFGSRHIRSVFSRSPSWAPICRSGCRRFSNNSMRKSAPSSSSRGSTRIS